jgi:hypothetical protein
MGEPTQFDLAVQRAECEGDQDPEAALARFNSAL